MPRWFPELPKSLGCLSPPPPTPLLGNRGRTQPLFHYPRPAKALFLEVGFAAAGTAPLLSRTSESPADSIGLLGASSERLSVLAISAGPTSATPSHYIPYRHLAAQ